MRLLPFTAMSASCALAAGLLMGFTAQAQADPVLPAAEPAVGECLDFPLTAEWFDPFVVGASVDCSAPHNSEVFALGTYPADYGAPSTEQERIEEFSYFVQVCPQPFDTFDDYLETGGAPRPMIPSRFYLKASAPTDEEWEAGSRVVRCVAYAINGPFGKDKPTAWTGNLPDRIATSGYQEFARCSQKGKPMSGVDQPVFRCRKANQWIAVGRAMDLKGTPGNPYPGTQVQKNADKACLKVIKGFTKGKKVKPFGAVEPQDMWDEGFREALCFIPLKNWNGKF